MSGACHTYLYTNNEDDTEVAEVSVQVPRKRCTREKPKVQLLEDGDVCAPSTVTAVNSHKGKDCLHKDESGNRDCTNGVVYGGIPDCCKGLGARTTDRVLAFTKIWDSTIGDTICTVSISVLILV
jgi:hypothetical protein